MLSMTFYKKLLTMISIMCFLNLTVHYLKYSHGYDTLLGFFNFFNFDREENLQTWFSSIILFISSVLLWIISRSDKITYRRHWTFLSFAFLFLSLDEAAVFHEKINDIIWDITGPVLSIEWLGLYPYLVILILVSYTYTKYLFSIPAFYRKLFIFSGFIFILGSVGLDGVGSIVYYKYDTEILYLALFTVEELMEMIGVATFIYGLLRYMEEHDIPVTIKSSQSEN